jgi:non-specific serine/threonine protein kinase
LIGREQEVRTVVESVAGARLVTLVGTGGVGKTRLAIQVAAEVSDDFDDGAVFVALAALADPALLPGFVAAALGIREEASESEFLLEALVGWLSIHTVLLVLDNCEHLVEAVAVLAQRLLERCPRLRILATSRQRLGLTGELIFRVPSLSAPEPERLPAGEQAAATRVMEYPAVQLFVERAAMLRPGFQLAGQAQAVAQICRRLDGIPLAIELAAARVGVLTVEQIAARLDDRFRLLTGGSRVVLPRHQTLRALIDWSYDQLPEAERALLRGLAVFTGGWTLEAAEAMVTPPTPDVLDLLASLVDKSLVLAEEHARGLRYRMLETVREYALEKLVERGEEETARGQHLAYYLHLAEENAPSLSGPDPDASLALVESEMGNLRAALAWAQTATVPADASLRLTAALWPFWEMHGYPTEGRAQILAALSRRDLPDSSERAQVLLGAATLAFVQVELAAALAYARDSLERFRTLGDRRGTAAALLLLGHALLESGDAVAASSLLAEGVDCCRQCGWTQGSALASVHLGLVAQRQGEMPQAQSYLEQGRALAEMASDARTLATSLHHLAFVALETGDATRARSLWEQSLEIRRSRHKHAASLTLRALGQLARHQKDLVGARRYLEEAAATCREQGNRTHLAIALHELGCVFYEQGEYALALPAYEESRDLCLQVDSGWAVPCSMNLGSTLFHLGAPAQASELHRESLRSYQRDGSQEGIAWALERLSVVEAAIGDATKAARLLGAASAAREQVGSGRSRADQTDWDQAIGALQAALGEAAFARLWTEGRALSAEQAVAYSLTPS